MKIAYADPPYYKQGKRLYGNAHDMAHIWDSKQTHLDLVQRLTSEFDAWALSCNPQDLTWLLPSCPEQTRVCAWVKTFHQIRPLCSVQYAWEPVLVFGARQIKHRNPMVRDWLACARSMRKGTIGAKPAEFNVWLLDVLGYDPNEDTFTDLFPGSNGMAGVLMTYEAVPVTSQTKRKV
jgi:hypothetical protein